MIPGGHVAASQAIREQIDGARERLDVINPYLTDRGMIERIVAAAQRGVRVRVVVSKTSNNAQATAALKHHYADMLGAGIEVWELPDTVVHAKVIVADDIVSFGTVNLDAWALYRNSEIMMIARSAEAAALFEERLFEPDIARSHPGEPPSGSPRAPAELVVEQTRTRPLRRGAVGRRGHPKEVIALGAVAHTLVGYRRRREHLSFSKSHDVRQTRKVDR